jgi:hypothetical protein
MKCHSPLLAVLATLVILAANAAVGLAIFQRLH